MNEFTRKHDDFTPIPFFLVSSSDHITPVTSAPVGQYFITKVTDTGIKFFSGSGQAYETGNGCYEIIPGTDERDFGVHVISIPGSGSHDPVHFRVYFSPNIEVVPAIQDDACLMMFVMVSSTDHVSPVPSLSPQVIISRDGDQFNSLGSGTPIGRGFYFINAPTFAEDPKSFNNECIYVIKATAPGADATYDSFQVFRYYYPA